MKIPIRSEAQLQRTVDIAVEHFQKSVDDALFADAGESTVRGIYLAVLNAGRPVDYRYIVGAMGWECTPTNLFRVAGRLPYLEQRGYLVNVGRGPRHPRGPGRGALLYSAVPLEQIPAAQARIESARRKLVDATEFAAACANDVPQCLAQRMFLPANDRDAEIVKARLGGAKLQDLADIYGISRERIRQIVELAMYPKENNMKVTIEHGIPVPTGRTGGKAYLVPWGELTVGDSVFLTPENGQSVEKMRANTGNSAYAFARRQTPPWKFTTRVQEEKNMRGVRVWRIE